MRADWGLSCALKAKMLGPPEHLLVIPCELERNLKRIGIASSIEKLTVV